VPRAERTRSAPRDSETFAYAFFHAPRPGVSRARYERTLLAFHGTLARRKTPGFRESAALRFPTVPWGSRPTRPLYLDWWVLDGFGALDPLRDVAYHPPWIEAHREIARLFGSGWGSVCSTRGRASAPRAPAAFWWFSGPEGRGKALLRDWVDHGPPSGVLWRRQLALGRNPEFCYVSEEPPPKLLVGRSRAVVPEYLKVPR
jgi:hypothetical protein